MGTGKERARCMAKARGHMERARMHGGIAFGSAQLRGATAVTGFWLDGLRVEIETTVYKLKPLFKGGNNSVYAVRIANVDGDGVDVDAERMIRDARAAAISGRASDLSSGSVAVLIHDLLLLSNYPTKMAVDIASQIVERGGVWTGAYVVQLATAPLGIRDALIKGDYCNPDFRDNGVADALQRDLGALFATPDAHVTVSGTRVQEEGAAERASELAYELMQIDGEGYTPGRADEWRALLVRADRASAELCTGSDEHKMMLGAVQQSAAKLRAKLPGPRWIEDLVVRVLMQRLNKKTLDKKRDEYWAEVERTAALSADGLAPRTYTRLVMWEAWGGIYVRLGVVLERFEFSLDEVQMCPSLTRRMFVESDGESALVDLYARASGRMRCVDTKPGNVVVRLPRARHELRDAGEPRAHYRERIERMRPRLALIDVDPYFCGIPSKFQEARAAGVSTVADLDASLSAHTPGGEIADYGLPPLYVAAMSLLVHCTVAAAMGSPYGYPYVRIAAVLISRWAKVEALVIQDRQEGMMVPDGARVHSQLKHYTQYTPEAVMRRGDPDAPDTRAMSEVLEDVRSVIGRRLNSAATNVLRLCIGPPLADPLMYEYTALILGQTKKHLTALITGASSAAGVYKRVTELAKRATNLPQLQQSMQAIENEMRTGVVELRPECMLEQCDVHYNADDTIRGLGHVFPVMLDRPLLAQRRIQTPVHERAPRVSRHRNDVPLDELDVHGVAALLHETVRGRFGEAVADNVARAVERTLSHSALDGATLWERAKNRELATTLRRMHIENSVARHIEHEIDSMDPRAVPLRATDVVELGSHIENSEHEIGNMDARAVPPDVVELDFGITISSSP
jgi:hypothetical protein